MLRQLSTSFTERAIGLTAIVGIMVGIIPALIQLATDAKDDTNFDPSPVFNSENARYSIVVGLSLAGLTFLEVLTDFIFVRKRNLFELSVLLGFILLVFVPNFVYFFYGALHVNIVLLSLISTAQSVLGVGMCLSLLVHYGRPHIWSSRFVIAAYFLNTVAVVITNYLPLLNPSTQYLLNVCVASEASIGCILCFGIPFFQWFVYVLRTEKKNLTSHDIFCTGQLVSIILVAGCDIGVLSYTGASSSGTLGVLGSGVTAFTLSNYISTFYSIFVVVVNGHIFRYEAVRSQERQRTQLEQKTGFVRYISHEMRTLNSAMMGLQLLQRKLTLFPQNSQIKFLLDVVNDLHKSCSTSVGILDELLDFEKLDAGLMQLELELVSVQRFVRKVVNSFEIFAVEKGVELNLTFVAPNATSPFQKCQVMADESKLSQVLRNMLSNALKFTPRLGKVTVEVDLVHSPDSSQESALERTSLELRTPSPVSSVPSQSEQSDTLTLRIRVTDTGPGISEENQARLFKEVIQFNPGQLQGGKGSGLGLWISNKIMELHHGSISVHSAGEGFGSTFTMTLEATLLTDEDAEEDSSKVDDDGTGSAVPADGALHPIDSITGGDTTLELSCTPEAQSVGRVLVVDDAALNRKMLCRLLEGSCTGLDIAEDGLVAVDMVTRSLAEGTPYYAVLMDFQMPNMDGPTATKAIRELGFTGIILGVTGNALRSDQEFFIAHGADKVLTKPVNFAAIIEAMQSLEGVKRGTL